MKQIAVVASMMLTLTACSTAEGIGQDVEDAGGSIQNAANEVEDDLEE